MNIIHTVPSIALKYGGPPRSVTQLCANFKELHQPVRLHSFYHKNEENIKVSDDIDLKLVPRNRKLITDLDLLGNGNCNVLLHHHGIWLKCAHDVIQFGHLNQIPVILSPRGMLEPWALKHNYYKKKIAWWLYQKSDLNKVKGFHATAYSEAEHIRKLGFSQPIAVIPNGVALPKLSVTNIKEKKIKPFKKVLFLSRLHPKKGLDILLKSWSKISPLNAKLEIVGNDDRGYKAKLISLISQLGLNDQVSISEPQYGLDKVSKYQSADLFVLPSYSENFGIVVAEALSYGIPVITTKGCPWEDLETYKCGWWTDITVDSFSNALSEAINLSSNDLRDMGERGIKLVEEKYQWGQIAEQMFLFYKFLLNEGERPKFVL